MQVPLLYFLQMLETISHILIGNCMLNSEWSILNMHRVYIANYLFCATDKAGQDYKACCAATISSVLHLHDWVKYPSTPVYIQVGVWSFVLTFSAWSHPLLLTFVNGSECEFYFRDDAYLSRLPVSVILSWYQRQGYIRSMADLIEKELGRFAKPEEVCLLTS